MLNHSDANMELQQRVIEAILKVKLAGVLDDQEMHALAFAAGVQVPQERGETRLQRLQRMAREAAQAAEQGY